MKLLFLFLCFLVVVYCVKEDEEEELVIGQKNDISRIKRSSEADKTKPKKKPKMTNNEQKKKNKKKRAKVTKRNRKSKKINKDNANKMKQIRNKVRKTQRARKINSRKKEQETRSYVKQDTCSGTTVAETCLQNAQLVLVYEQKQVKLIGLTFPNFHYRWQIISSKQNC